MPNLAFVGGPLDGQHLSHNGVEYVHSFVDESGEFRLAHYHMVTLFISRGLGVRATVKFMRYSDLDDYQAVERLTLGYQRRPRTAANNVQVTDRRAQLGAMFGMGRRRQEEMTQRPHPHDNLSFRGWCVTSPGSTQVHFTPQEDDHQSEDYLANQFPTQTEGDPTLDDPIGMENHL